MTEEVNKDPIDPVEPTEVEKQAMEQGWVPKDQWNGEGKWRDAESFLDRGELFGKIDRQNRELRSLKEAQHDFKRHLETVRATEYKRALADLKAQKKEALREGDADAVVEIDEQMEEVREEEFAARQAAASRPAQSNGEDHPEFVSWKNKNSWYSNNAEMRKFADAYGAGLRANGVSPSEVLRDVEATVKQKYATRFSNPNREKASAVEGNAGSAASTKADKFKLSDGEHRMMKRIVATGAITEEKYIADLKLVKSKD